MADDQTQLAADKSPPQAQYRCGPHDFTYHSDAHDLPLCRTCSKQADEIDTITCPLNPLPQDSLNFNILMQAVTEGFEEALKKLQNVQLLNDARYFDSAPRDSVLSAGYHERTKEYYNTNCSMLSVYKPARAAHIISANTSNHKLYLLNAEKYKERFDPWSPRNALMLTEQEENDMAHKKFCVIFNESTGSYRVFGLSPDNMKYDGWELRWGNKDARPYSRALHIHCEEAVQHAVRMRWIGNERVGVYKAHKWLSRQSLDGDLDDNKFETLDPEHEQPHQQLQSDDRSLKKSDSSQKSGPPKTSRSAKTSGPSRTSRSAKTSGPSRTSRSAKTSGPSRTSRAAWRKADE